MLVERVGCDITGITGRYAAACLIGGLINIPSVLTGRGRRMTTNNRHNEGG